MLILYIPYYPTVQKKKAKFREVNWLAPQHRANECQSSALHSGQFDTEARSYPPLPASWEPVKPTTQRQVTAYPCICLFVCLFWRFTCFCKSYTWAHPGLSWKTRRKAHFGAHAVPWHREVFGKKGLFVAGVAPWT